MGNGRKLALVLCAAQFVDVLSITAVVVALPDIKGDLHLSSASAQGVVSAYALLFGALLLLAGRLADLYGRRRLLVLGLATFALAGLVGGVAPGGVVLVASRAAQGAAAAATVPAALAVLTERYAGAARRRALAAWTAAGAGGGATGFVIGGVVTGALDWRATLFVIAAMAAAAAAGAMVVVPVERPERVARAGLDVRGGVLATLGLLLLLLALTRAESGATDALAAVTAAAGALLLSSFAFVERRVSDPLLRPRTFRNRPLAVGVMASFALTATTSPAAVLGTTYLQSIRDWSATATGLAFVPFSLAVVVGSGIGQRLLGARGARLTMVTGLAMICTALALAATVTASDGEPRLIAALVLSGLGLGCAAVAATATGTAAVPAGDRGLASGLVNTGTQLGTAIGVAVIVPLAGAEVPGLRAGYLAAAGLAALAALFLTRWARTG